MFRNVNREPAAGTEASPGSSGVSRDRRWRKVTTSTTRRPASLPPRQSGVRLREDETLLDPGDPRGADRCSWRLLGFYLRLAGISPGPLGRMRAAPDLRELRVGSR